MLLKMILGQFYSLLLIRGSALTCLMKARIIEPEDIRLLDIGSVNTVLQQPDHAAATDQQ
jgi:hypothetical protein